MKALRPVHVFRMDARSKRRVLAERHDYLDIMVQGQTRVIVQDGQIRYADGVPVERPLPQWLKDHLDRVTDEGLAGVGLSRIVLDPPEQPMVPAAEVKEPEIAPPEPAEKPSAPVPQPAPRKRSTA